MDRLSIQNMYASVREYLQDLAESGVDGVPAEVVTCEPEQASTARPAATATPTSLEQVRRQLGDCQRCELARSRRHLVFGSGNENARLLFVGEAPGADEDKQGQPFVGEAGQILTRMIDAMGLKREQVYICNVLKCRPPSNRNPHKDEITACSPFLIQQIEVIKPEVIVALGTFAAQTLLGSKEPISRLRGSFHDCHGIALMPTFHPSFLLHHKENKQHFWDVWSDMEQVLKRLGLPVPDKKRPAAQQQ